MWYLGIKIYKKIILSLYKTVVHHQGIQSILECISHWCDILYGETLFMWKMQICCTKTRYMYIVAIFCKFSRLKNCFLSGAKALKENWYWRGKGNVNQYQPCTCMTNFHLFCYKMVTLSDRFVSPFVTQCLFRYIFENFYKKWTYSTILNYIFLRVVIIIFNWWFIFSCHVKLV